ncbi:L-threonylcarbamoyladenylate synthase [Methanobacterium sp.]|uniref:L-threonylcarbamoyladenylate synthase n=1 Tax=Methanobacterium sp. TaxID=2164 RepID=UPI003C74F3B0
MKILKINANNPEKDKIKAAIAILKRGGTVVYPTDTVYGIGANIFDSEAIQKIYHIKKRSQLKPISACVSKIQDIHKIAHMDKNTERIVKKILPGPFTVILKKKNNVPGILTSGGEKIGVRIPDSKVCMEISREFPITTTSANISGKKIPESLNDILKQLDSDIDLILDAGVCKHGIHSTVIDMTSSPKIVRKGAIIPDLNY